MTKPKMLLGVTYKVTYRHNKTIYTTYEVVKYECFDEYYGITEEYRTKCKVRDSINKLTIRNYYKKNFPDWAIYEIKRLG